MYPETPKGSNQGAAIKPKPKPTDLRRASKPNKHQDVPALITPEFFTPIKKKFWRKHFSEFWAWNKKCNF